MYAYALLFSSLLARGGSGNIFLIELDKTERKRKERSVQIKMGEKSDQSGWR